MLCKKKEKTEISTFNLPQYQEFKLPKGILKEEDLKNYEDTPYGASVWTINEEEKTWKVYWANKVVLDIYGKTEASQLSNIGVDDSLDQLMENLKATKRGCTGSKKRYSETFFSYSSKQPVYLHSQAKPIKMKGVDETCVFSIYSKIDLNLNKEDSYFLNCTKSYINHFISLYDLNGEILMRNNNSQSRFREMEDEEVEPSSPVQEKYVEIKKHGFSESEVKKIFNSVNSTKIFGTKIFEKETQTKYQKKTIILQVEVLLIRDPHNGGKSILVIENDVTNIATISSGLLNVFHDLRVALTGISGSLELLNLNNNTRETKKLLDIAENSKNVSLSLLNDILDFSKLQSGEFTINPNSIEIEELFLLIDQVVESFSTIVYQKNIEVYTRYPMHDMNLKNKMKIDKKRIHQILSNLLSNAIKFTNMGKVEVNLKIEGTDLIFSIKDNGVGIPKEKLDTLFTPFKQITKSDSKIGTGLGLSIAKKLVNKMNGKIEVTSIENEGSEFSFTIPIEYDLQSPKEKEKKLDKKILIIDENLHYESEYLKDILDRISNSVVVSNLNSISNLNFKLFDIIIWNEIPLDNFDQISSKLDPKKTIFLMTFQKNVSEKLKKFDYIVKPIKPFSFSNYIKRKLLDEDVTISHIDEDHDVFAWISKNTKDLNLENFKDFGEIELYDNHQLLFSKNFSAKFVFIDVIHYKDYFDLIEEIRIQKKNCKIICFAKVFTKKAIKETLMYGFDDVISDFSIEVLTCLFKKWNVNYFNSSQKKIIFAEDNKFNQKIFSKFTKKFGNFDLEFVSNGEKLLEKYEDKSIIFTDYYMNELSGLDVAKKIKEKKSDIPIILVSGHNPGIHELINAKVDDFILKPIVLSDLNRVFIKYAHFLDDEEEDISKTERKDVPLPEWALDSNMNNMELEGHLEIFNFFPHPVNVVHLEENTNELRLLWGNTAGLNVWSKKSVEELTLIDMAQTSSQNVPYFKRILNYIQRTSNIFQDEYLIFPNGKPRTVQLCCAPIFLNKEEFKPSTLIFFQIPFNSELNEQDTRLLYCSKIYMKNLISIYDENAKKILFRNDLEYSLFGDKNLIPEEISKKIQKNLPQTKIGEKIVEENLVLKMEKEGLYFKDEYFKILDPCSGKKVILSNKYNITELKSINQLIFEFTHSIRTPLNGVMGMLQYLKHETNENLYQFNSIIESALDSSEHLNLIFNNILKMCEYQISKKLNEKLIYFVNFIQEIEKFLISKFVLIKVLNIQLLLKDVKIVVDVDLIYQIIFHLFSFISNNFLKTNFEIDITEEKYLSLNFIFEDGIDLNSTKEVDLLIAKNIINDLNGKFVFANSQFYIKIPIKVQFFHSKYFQVFDGKTCLLKTNDSLLKDIICQILNELKIKTTENLKETSLIIIDEPNLKELDQLKSEEAKIISLLDSNNIIKVSTEFLFKPLKITKFIQKISKIFSSTTTENEEKIKSTIVLFEDKSEPSESNIFSEIYNRVLISNSTEETFEILKENENEVQIIFVSMKFADKIELFDQSKFKFCILTSNPIQKFKKYLTIQKPLTSEKLKTILNGCNGNFKFLIVEDNKMNQLVLAKLLKKIIPNCDITIAVNGQEGVDLSVKEDYQLILMDVNMPIKDGIAASKEIKENKKTKGIPILIVTANFETEAKRIKEVVDIEDVIHKPVKMDELKLKIYKILKINIE
eukprot:gene7008-11173_t